MPTRFTHLSRRLRRQYIGTAYILLFALLSAASEFKYVIHEYKQTQACGHALRYEKFNLKLYLRAHRMGHCKKMRSNRSRRDANCMCHRLRLVGVI